MPGPGMEHQQRFERDLTLKVVGLLEPVVGPGRVRVNVSARFSSDTAEETEEVWDQTPVMRSRQSSSDTSASTSSASKTARAGGVAGARANQPPRCQHGQPGPSGRGREGTSGRVSETVNYEIGKKTRHTVAPGGQIERLSVAVIVDDSRAPGAEGQPATTKPRRVGRDGTHQGAGCSLGRARHRPAATSSPSRTSPSRRRLKPSRRPRPLVEAGLAARSSRRSVSRWAT